jgi:hypothetical protein
MVEWAVDGERVELESFPRVEALFSKQNEDKRRRIRQILKEKQDSISVLTKAMWDRIVHCISRKSNE